MDKRLNIFIGIYIGYIYVDYSSEYRVLVATSLSNQKKSKSLRHLVSHCFRLGILWRVRGVTQRIGNALP